MSFLAKPTAINDNWIEPIGLNRIHIEILRVFLTKKDLMGKPLTPPLNSMKLTYLAGTSWTVASNALEWMVQHNLLRGKLMPNNHSKVKRVMYYDITEHGRLVAKKLEELRELFDWTKWVTTEEAKKLWRKQYHTQKQKKHATT